MDKKKHNNKITGFEFVLLAIMFLCFIASLYFLIINDRLYLIVFFTLHSCLAAAYFFISNDRYSRVLPEIDEITLQGQKDMEQLDREAVAVSRLKQENDTLTGKNEELNSKLSALQTENDNLTRSLAEANLHQSLSSMEQNAGLLPPGEDSAEFDFITMIKKVIDDVSAWQSPDIRISLSTSCESLLYKADERFLKILFLNLIDNAIKHLKRNDTFVITVSNMGDMIFIVCKDNGSGISHEEAEHLFELNYQGSNHVSGSGLGLAQVKAIVEHYHGTIYAKSDDGLGIYIQLPCSAE